MSRKTILIGQNNLLKAGLTRLLAGTPFQPGGKAVCLSEITETEIGDEGAILLVEKLPDVRGMEDDIARLKAGHDDCFIVLLASTMETDQLALSFAAGADGYLLDEISPQALVESLQLVSLGEKVFPSRLAAMIGSEGWGQKAPILAGCDDHTLSHREVEIVQRLTEGLPNKIIAHDLEITEATVKVHLKTILKKLGVANRTQAAIWAVQRGLAPLPAMLNAEARA